MGSPLVAIVCSLERFELQGFGILPHHAVYERYVEALIECSDVSPLLIPSLGLRARATAMAADCVSRIDGLLLPGGASNVAPELYGAHTPEVDTHERDHDRDATALTLIRACLSAGVPMLGICRGMQEINVALGGTLSPAVHELPGRRDHRSRKERPFAERYAPAHPVSVARGGWLEHELEASRVPTDDLTVNSLHGQAVDRLGQGVVAEASADDGTIEAIRVEEARALALGVQWHVEWHTHHPLHATVLKAFGNACQRRAAARA